MSTADSIEESYMPSMVIAPGSAAREPFRMAGVSVHVSATGETRGSSVASRGSVARTPAPSRVPRPPAPRSSTGGQAGSSGATRDVNKHQKPLIVEEDKDDEHEEHEEDEEDKDNEEDEEDEGKDEGAARYSTPTPWSQDTELTASQKKKINAEKNFYGRQRAYNIIRNKRCLDALKLPALAKETISSAQSS